MPEVRHAQALLVVSVLREQDDPPEWAVEYVEKCLIEAEMRGSKRALREAADELMHEQGRFKLKLRNLVMGFDHLFIAAWLKRRAEDLN